MPKTVVDTIIAESDDENDSFQLSHEQEPSWYPHPKYNVSSLGSYESRTDLD
jgi:hypothetical protein